MVKKQQNPHRKPDRITDLQRRCSVRRLPRRDLIYFPEYIQHVCIVVECHDCKCRPEKANQADEQCLAPLPDKRLTARRLIMNDIVRLPQILHRCPRNFPFNLLDNLHDVSNQTAFALFPAAADPLHDHRTAAAFHAFFTAINFSQACKRYIFLMYLRDLAEFQIDRLCHNAAFSVCASGLKNASALSPECCTKVPSM